MNTKNSSLDISEANPVKNEILCNLPIGITERLLRKYKPSKVLRFAEGCEKDIKNDLAA